MSENQQSNLLRLNEVQFNSDSDKQALQSLGVTSDSDQDDVETNHNWDAKEIKANLIASNSNNGNGKTSH